MPSVLFETWGRIGALLIALPVAYVWLVVVLRVSGKRSIAKLNAFDFVVTIALGSILATVIVSRDVPLAEGLLALVGLVILQYVVARATVASTRFDRLVTSNPTALLVDGELRDDALRRSRVRRDEVASALRKEGVGSFAQAELVVLETDGTLSVLRDVGDGTAIDDVDGADALASRARARG